MCFVSPSPMYAWFPSSKFEINYPIIHYLEIFTYLVICSEEEYFFFQCVSNISSRCKNSLKDVKSDN